MTAIDPAIYAMGPIFAGPTADGTNGQVLVTNGSKQLSFSTIVSGVSALNSLTGSLTIAVGTSGTDVAVSASGSTVTVNIPDAGASARGVLTTGTQTIAGAKTFTGGATFTPPSSSAVPLTVKGAALQSASLQEWQNSSGTIVGSISPAGEMMFVGNVTASKTATNIVIMASDGGTTNAIMQVIGTAGAWIGAQTNHSLYLVTNNTQRITVSAAGLVGIGDAPVAGSRVAVSGLLTATEGISSGPVTFAVLNATTATATLGVYRITDRANRLAYPDGTNWRFVGDDAIIS